VLGVPEISGPDFFIRVIYIWSLGCQLAITFFLSSRSHSLHSRMALVILWMPLVLNLYSFSAFALDRS